MRYDSNYARADIEVDNVTFDSFCKCRDLIKGDNELKHSATLYYDGSDISGDVRVSFARYAENDKKNRIKTVVMDTLKIF